MRRYLLLFLTILLIVPVSGVFAEDLTADVLKTEVVITPTKFTGPAMARVEINLTDTRESGKPVYVELIDPDGNPCTSFGDNGIARLSPGSAAAYSANWEVTDAQLDAGGVVYSCVQSFTRTGSANRVTKPIYAVVSRVNAESATTTETAPPPRGPQPATPLRDAAAHTLSKPGGRHKPEPPAPPAPPKAEPPVSPKEESDAKLQIARYIYPGPSARKGETVSIVYNVNNIGSVDVTDITISDLDVSPDPVILELLGPGEEVEMTMTFVMGDEAVITNAEISYSYEGHHSKPAVADAVHITVKP